MLAAGEIATRPCRPIPDTRDPKAILDLSTDQGDGSEPARRPTLLSFGGSRVFVNETTEVNGVELHFAVDGKAPLLVLLPGVNTLSNKAADSSLAFRWKFASHQMEYSGVKPRTEAARHARRAPPCDRYRWPTSA